MTPGRRTPPSTSCEPPDLVARPLRIAQEWKSDDPLGGNPPSAFLGHPRPCHLSLPAAKKSHHHR